MPTVSPNSTLERPTWAALGLGSLGALLALSLDQPTLAQGGLSLVAVASLAAALVGLPVAMAASRTPVPDTRPVGAIVHGMTEVWTVMAVAAATAPLVGQLGLVGLLLAAVAWATAGFAPGTRRLGAGLLAVGGVVCSLGLIGVSAVEGPGWSLLEPRWWPWQPWVGLGLIGGLVIASAGLGPVEGSGRLSRGLAASVGVGLLALVAAALRVAAPFEAGVLEGGTDAGLVMLAVFLAPAAILATGRGSGPRAMPAVVGLLATVIFAGPAASALPLWWTGLLPLGLALLLGLRAATGSAASTLDRVLLAGGAVVALAVPFLVAPGFPDPLAAALLGLAPVAVVWVAGTRALLLREAPS